MRIISFDVGIKTLSFAVLDSSAADPLLDWKTISLCEPVPPVCCRQDCTVAVKFVYDGRLYCRRHGKDVPGSILPSVRLTPTQLAKLTPAKVLAVASELIGHVTRGIREREDTPTNPPGRA